MNLLKNSLIAPSLALLLVSSLYANDSYSVDTSSLGDAIKQISKKADMPYVVDMNILKGKSANEVKDATSLETALDKLLEGTELEAIIKNNTIVIREKKLSGNRASLGDVDVIAEKDNDLQLNKETSTGSRLGLTLRETPASIEVVTSEVMEQRGITDVTDIVSKTTGITGGISGHGPGGRFAARGFTGVPGVTFLNDGIKVSGAAFSNRASEIANLDRVEVIRGASSILHGEVSVGGTVNLITKQPSFSEQESELGFKVGSYDSYGFNFGTGGVIVDDTLAYRVDFSSKEKGSNFDGEKRDLDSLSVGLLYKINDDLLTSLTINKFRDDTEDAYTGTPLIDGKLSESNRKINYNAAIDNIERGDNLFIKQGIEWLPTSNIEVKNTLYYQDIKTDTRQSWSHLQTDPNTVKIRSMDISEEQDLIGNRLDILYTGNISKLENKLLVGMDVNKANWKRDDSPFGVPGQFDHETNIYNPERDYFVDLGGVYKTKRNDVEIKQTSLYLEDQLSITDSFKVLAGLRYDNYDGKWKFLRNNTQKNKEFDDISYRLGTVYDITHSSTIYATYSKAIEAGYAMVRLNEGQLDLDLTEASQYEIGLKQSFWDNKGQLTLAFYDIKKENMFVRDPNTNDYISAGEQSSRGIEFDFAIEATEKLQINGNLAYNKVKYDNFVTGTNDYTGNTPHSIPKYTANLGFRYMATSNLGIGTWINHVDSFYADDANTIKLPSYTTADLILDYTYNNNTTFSFAIKNVTNELYATSGRNRAEVFLGDARNYEFGIKYKF